MRFERIKGRKSEALEDMFDRTIILELKNGNIYGGNVDGCEEGIVWLVDINT